jgi:hypothetical protein
MSPAAKQRAKVAEEALPAVGEIAAALVRKWVARRTAPAADIPKLEKLGLLDESQRALLIRCADDLEMGRS